MRPLLWITIASFTLYNAAIILPTVRGSYGSLESYIYGLMIFMGPFVTLHIATAFGLVRPILNFCAYLGALVLVLVAWLIATKQALYVAPALLMSFGALNIVVLLFALVARVIRNIVGNAKPNTSFRRDA